jgi:hypothetical protein
MMQAEEKLTPKQLHDMGLREMQTPHGTLRYWENKIFKEAPR